MWTEHVRTEDRAEYMMFPRAAAHRGSRLVAGRTHRLAVVFGAAAGAARALSRARRRLCRACRRQRRDASLDARTSHELESCSEKILLSLEDDAPLQGERAVFLVDIMNPCWIYRGRRSVRRSRAIAASVGQVPFNFQIGDDVKKIPLRKPQSAAGELEVRIDGCEGEKIATLPLAPAAKNYAVTELPPVALRPRDGPARSVLHVHAGAPSIRSGCSMPCSCRPCRRRGGAHPATAAVNR